MTTNQCDMRVGGLPGLAIRVGAALEGWGRRAAATRPDPDRMRRHVEWRRSVERARLERELFALRRQ